jgi:hypothetical protein
LWREKILERAFELDAGADRILRAEAAEIGADASFHHADALGISLSGRHSEVGPDFREIGLGDAEQVDALAAWKTVRR